jgi:hypothetical protein
MSNKSARPSWMPTPGWSKLPVDDAAKLKLDNAASDARRRGNNTSSSIGPDGEAHVKVADLGDGRYETTITHDGVGQEPTEHGDLESAITETRRHFLERQRSGRLQTMRAEDATQAARGNAASTNNEAY